jgi:invasion protein IalB
MNTLNIITSLALCAAVGVTAWPVVAQPSPATLPGGASSLQETHQDWQVGCALQATGKRCVLSQIQAQQNGQRILTLELNTPVGTAISGTLVLPFGLAFAKGAAIQLDDKPIGQPLAFRTCLPGGCLVPVNFDTATVTALRTGAAMKVKTMADDGKDMMFSISLRGFGPALDRVAALAR